MFTHGISDATRRKLILHDTSICNTNSEEKLSDSLIAKEERRKLNSTFQLTSFSSRTIGNVVSL